MNIAEIRQKYPQYENVSDEQLARGLHKKYYSNLDFNDFAKRIGYQPDMQTPQEDFAQKYGADALAQIQANNDAYNSGGKAVANGLRGAVDFLTGTAEGVNSGIDSVLSGATFGFYDKLNPEAKARREKLQQRAESAGLGGANKIAQGTADVSGMFLSPANYAGLRFIGKGANLASKATRSAGVSGAIGGLTGAANTENIDDLASNVAGGAGIGATIGGALPLAGGALKLAGKGFQQILGKTTGAGDKAIADAFTAGTQGDKSFLRKMAESINAEGLEKKVENNFNKIKQNRNRAYEEDITRLKLETADKKLDIKPVVEDIKAIIREEGGGAEYLVDDDTAQVLAKTKDTINKFYKDTSRHNLEGFDNLKKKLQDIVKTKEGTNADRIKTQIANSVKGQILKQSPEYKAIQDNYAKDSEILNDLKKVFSLNRNANSETILRKVQSTARNNANTDWSYRAQLLEQLDPTGEIQQEISANALNTWTPRGGLGGLVGMGGIFARDPALIAMSSPRLAGYGSYGLGRAVSKIPSGNISPYLAQYLANNQ